MPLREGSGATYIGVAGIADVGDRCVVLSDEGRYANVRWVSGAKVGSYEPVPVHDLVGDRRTRYSAFEGDEFGFEPEPPKAVRVATAMVYANGGDEALLRALDHDQMLGNTRRLVRQALSELHEALRGDNAWREVVSELGSDGEAFMRYAVAELFTAALKEEPHEAEED